eukprot:TRINITY_DN6892_c0_g2_i1.p1 TRINITY_DN6892_c0_g2~~TRINITY_DN6892_c0_g2_i1.p1  ORF type:complete len:246 (+),score=-4.12 TRINITY_DN6892_c0_g2_i1:213-950(+)
MQRQFLKCIQTRLNNIGKHEIVHNFFSVIQVQAKATKVKFGLFRLLLQTYCQCLYCSVQRESKQFKVVVKVKPQITLVKILKILTLAQTTHTTTTKVQKGKEYVVSRESQQGRLLSLLISPKFKEAFQILRQGINPVATTKKPSNDLTKKEHNPRTNAILPGPPSFDAHECKGLLIICLEELAINEANKELYIRFSILPRITYSIYFSCAEVCSKTCCLNAFVNKENFFTDARQFLSVESEEYFR